MGDIDVTVLRLGIDAAARDHVQARMRSIAERGDTRTPAGLTAMLRDAISELRAARASWTHAAAQGGAPVPAAEAQRHFGEAVESAHARFGHQDVIRNVDGKLETHEATRLSTGGPSVVVVTLVVAARKELADVADVRSAGAMERALEELAALAPEDFVAMEVIWAPADPRDRPSLDEVERKHPELVRLERSA